MGIGKVAVHQIHQVLAAGLQGTGDDFKILLFSATPVLTIFKMA